MIAPPIASAMSWNDIHSVIYGTPFYDPNANCLSDTTSTGTLTGKNNKEKIWCYLITTFKLTKNGAAGLMGNMERESGFVPDKWQYGSYCDNKQSNNCGYGLVQWSDQTYKWDGNDTLWEFSGDGNAKFPSTSGKVSELQTQLDYLLHTLEKRKPDLLKYLRKTDITPEEAADEYLRNYGLFPSYDVNDCGSPTYPVACIGRKNAGNLYKELKDLPCGSTSTPTPADTSGATSCCPDPNDPINGVSEGTGGSGGVYRSGLQGPYILEQFVIHLLIRLSQKYNKPVSDFLTEEHVVALLAFAYGEGGDINNPSIFNPWNLSLQDPDLGARPWDAGGSGGQQAYGSFDQGVEANARAMSHGYQSRLGMVLGNPNSTAAQFMYALTYYKKYPGNLAWATASMGSAAPGYLRSRMQLVDYVRHQYGIVAGLVIGTPEKEQMTHNYNKNLITYKDLLSGGSGGSSPITSTSCNDSSVIEPPNIIKMYSGSAVKAMDHGPLSKPKGFIIHFTQSPSGEGMDLPNFFLGQGMGYGVQFQIGPTGKIYEFFPMDNMRLTWHAGSVNDRAIGVEITGADGLALIKNKAQFDAVASLSKYVCDYYKMPCSDPKGDITNTPVSGAQGLLGHDEAPQGGHVDPDVKEPGNINICTNKTFTDSDRHDASVHAYMIKLRRVLGYSKFVTGKSGCADGGAVSNLL